MSVAVAFGASQPRRACFELLGSTAELPDLDLCRPEPVSPAEKAFVLASLPTEGEVQRLTGFERAKLDAVRAVLRRHARDAIYEVKVVDIGPMTTALYERAVLLISRPALDFLNADELQGLAAHEVGHEYVWDQFEAAVRAKDDLRKRQLELVCDRVAAQTLLLLGIPPSRFTRGLERAFAYNRARFGVALNELSYPTLRERAEVIKTTSLPAKQQQTPVLD